MNIRFDGLSNQVLVQQSTGTRLNTLLGAIQSAGTSFNDPWVVSYSTDPITAQQLKGIHVFVVLSRGPEAQYAYATSELDAIADYVNLGGNLLLMTSHPPNFVNDAPLAARFGVTLRSVFVSMPTVHSYTLIPMTMSAHCLNDSLKDNLLYHVTSLVVHDSCEIVAPADAVSIARFPDLAVVSSGVAPRYRDFALLLYRGAGKVIIVGNSGMVCDYGSPHPSCGFAPLGSNLLFFLGCVRFLTGLPSPSYPGLCPGEPNPAS